MAKQAPAVIPSPNEVISTAAPGHGAWGRLRKPSHGIPWSDVRRVVRGHISVCVRLSKESDVAEPGDQRRRDVLAVRYVLFQIWPQWISMKDHWQRPHLLDLEIDYLQPLTDSPKEVAESQSATRKTHRKAHTVLPRNVEVNPLCTGRQRRRCRVKFTKSIMHGPCTM